jgi:hypothetical protein
LLVLAALGAGTAGRALAAVPDAFSRGPRIDVEDAVDYRWHYLNPDDAGRGDAPPDRVGRERLAETRGRIARSAIQRLGHDVTDELSEDVPGVAAVRERYDHLTTFRLRREGVADDPSSAAPQGGRAPVTLRLRVDPSVQAGVRPAAVVTWGATEGRLRLDPATESVDAVVHQPLASRLGLELRGLAERGGGSALSLRLRLRF